MKERILTNAQVVTEEAVFKGSVVIVDGTITQVDAGTTTLGEDMEGDYLIPGLVDVHTDSLEQQFIPRHGVYWPSVISAAMANDSMMHGCGITTVLDSICAEAFPEEETRRRMFNDCVAAVTMGEERGLFRSRHMLHLRCETADPKTPGILGEHLSNPLVKLASLMDHTPGQRQYRDVNKFRECYADEGWNDEEFDAVVKRLQNDQRKFEPSQRAAIIKQCREIGVPLASHDDASVEHVLQAQHEGISICEFPTTLEAARTASDAGMDIVMGAPNIVLGGSHSGNVSAVDVFREGVLTVLASDYVLSSLLLAPFQLHRSEGVPLQDCIALVTVNPSRMLALTDRGSIEPNQLADLIRVRVLDDQPIIINSWVGDSSQLPLFG